MTDDRDVQPDADRRMSRRGFLQGATRSVGAVVAASVAAPLVGATPGPAGAAEGAVEHSAAPAADPIDPDYPPGLQGMRGQNQASLQYAHALRDGSRFDQAQETKEAYDLVVVGAGMSGLAAAYYYRKRLPHARILILDNCDDFGGHARRVEFTIGGKVQMMGAGTQFIWNYNTYTPEGKALLVDVGVDPKRWAAATQEDFALFPQLKLDTGCFFDKANWGSDRLVQGYPCYLFGGLDVTTGAASPEAAAAALRKAWQAFLAKAPVDRATAADLQRIALDRRDYLPGLSVNEKIAKLCKMSYLAYLRDVMRVGPAAVKFHQHQLGWFASSSASGPDSYTAWFAYRCGFGGFDGLGLPPEAKSTANYVNETELGESIIFPDGMATVARLLVRWLIPQALPGSTMEDSVTARLNYGVLDDPRNEVRLRLSSTVINVKHVGDPQTADEAVVRYIKGGQAYSVRARGVVMAGFNAMLPYICPELPDGQKEALRLAVRKPVMTVNAALRNWRAFVAAGVSNVVCPTAFYPMFSLNYFPSLGGYRRTRNPDEPTLIQFTRGWEVPGLPEREQFKAGRAQFAATSLETFEQAARDQLQGALGKYGFDAARDIAGITVNRWAHGYATGANELFDPPWTREQLPWVRGRKRFGLITVANSDAGAIALTQGAFDQANRAVTELVADVVRPQCDLHYSELT